MRPKARLLVSITLTILTYLIVPPPDILKMFTSIMIGLSSYFLLNTSSELKENNFSKKIVYEKINSSYKRNYSIVSDNEKLRIEGIPITFFDNGEDCLLVVNDDKKIVFSFFFTENNKSPSKNVIVIPEEEEKTELESLLD